MRCASLFLFVLVASLPATQVTQAAVISASFQGTAGAGGLVGANTAGFVPVGNWNDITSPSLVTLKDDSGALTTTTASYSTTGPGVDTNSFPNPGDQALMNGLIYSDFSSTLSISLGGTIPYSQYDLYVYFNGGLPVSVPTNLQLFSIPEAGVSQQALEDRVGPENAYILATSSTHGNYVVFSGLTQANFTLQAASVNPFGSYGYVNGFQIVDTTPIVLPPSMPVVPEPATMALLGFSALSFLLMKRRKKREQVA